MTNFDNASEAFMGITLMDDYKMDYLTPLEKNSGHSSITLWIYISLSMFTNPVCKSTKTHIDYILAKNIDDEKIFFATPFKADHFCSGLFTEISTGKQKCKESTPI